MISEKEPQLLTWVLSSGMFLNTASESSYLMYVASFIENSCAQNKTGFNLAQMFDSACKNRLKLH